MNIYCPKCSDNEEPERELKYVIKARECRPLENLHHSQIVERFFKAHPEIPEPSQVIQYYTWSEVKSNPRLKSDTLIFVDGGKLEHPLNLGGAILINDGGIIQSNIKCGRFYKDGGVIEKDVRITALSVEGRGKR